MAEPEPALVRERRRILDHIERDRARLQAAVDDLDEAVHERVALGARVAEHPYLWVAGAVLLGALLGGRRRGAAPKRRR